MNSRPKKATAQAKETLKAAGVTRPPVPVEALAARMGINIVPEPLEPEVSGMLYRRAGHSLIIVNSRHALVRQRFSIAHEIGHYLLHPHEEAFVNHLRIDHRDAKSSLGIDAKEMEANSFAASLLMPEEWVYKWVKDALSKAPIGASDEDLIAKLARAFDVSQNAAHIRLVNLGILGSV